MEEHIRRKLKRECLNKAHKESEHINKKKERMEGGKFSNTAVRKKKREK